MVVNDSAQDNSLDTVSGHVGQILRRGRRTSIPSGAADKRSTELCCPRFSFDPQEGADVEFELTDSTDQPPLKNSQGTIAATVFYAHRNILSQRSEYFRVLLNNGMLESTQERIAISGVSVDMFTAVMNYIYFNKLNPDLDSVVNIFETCDLFLLEDGKKQCQQFIESEMPIDFLSKLLYEDDLLSCDLLAVCCAKASKNSAHFFSSPQVQKLTKGAFITLLKSNALALREVDVFRGVRSWLSAHQDESAASIMELVRFPLMDYEELVEEVEPSGVVPIKLILEAYRHLARPKTIPLTAEQRLNPRFTPRAQQEDLEGGTKVYTLSCSEEEHDHCATLAWPITNFSTISSQRHMSDEFELCGLKWRLWSYAAGEAKHADSFSVYLESIRTPEKEGMDFVRNTTFEFSLINPSSPSLTCNHPSSPNVLFTSEKGVWGNGLIELKQLYDKSLGYIQNDTVIVHLHLLQCLALKK